MSELTVGIDSLARGAVKVLRPCGDLDGHTYGDMEGALKAVVEAGETRVIVDLSGLKYMASRGMGMFLSARKAIEDAGGALVLMSPRPAVRDTVKLLGFDTIFRIVATEQEALAALEAGA